MSRDAGKRQAKVVMSVGLSVTLHISSMLSKLVNLAAIGCCSLQIHDPSWASLVSVVVVPSIVEKRQAKVAMSVGFLVTLQVFILSNVMHTADISISIASQFSIKYPQLLQCSIP